MNPWYYSVYEQDKNLTSRVAAELRRAAYLKDTEGVLSEAELEVKQTLKDLSKFRKQEQLAQAKRIAKQEAATKAQAEYAAKREARFAKASARVEAEFAEAKAKIKTEPSVSNFKINIPIHNNKGLRFFISEDYSSFAKVVFNLSKKSYKTKIYAETTNGATVEISRNWFWDSISDKRRVHLLVDIDDDVIESSEDYESLVLTIPANQLNQSLEWSTPFTTKSGWKVDVLRYIGKVDVIEKD